MGKFIVITISIPYAFYLIYFFLFYFYAIWKRHLLFLLFTFDNSFLLFLGRLVWHDLSLFYLLIFLAILRLKIIFFAFTFFSIVFKILYLTLFLIFFKRRAAQFSLVFEFDFGLNGLSLFFDIQEGISLVRCPCI